MLPDADRSKTRTTTSVGDAEGLVEIQVADICANHSGRCDAKLSIHVGTIHVDLPTILMHRVADLLDAILKKRTG